MSGSPVYHFIGLDLGQAQDFTALAVLEQAATSDALSLRHLARYALGTSYTQITQAVARLCQSSPALANAPLVVDQTGVGRAVVDMLRQAPGINWVIPVTITGGQTVTRSEDGGFHVPKKELVTCLQMALQNRQLKIARSLPDADTLVRELGTFQVKITAAAHEVFGTWREGQHDDLVLAVGLACWYAHRDPPIAEPFGVGPPGIIERAPEGIFMTDPGDDDSAF